MLLAVSVPKLHRHSLVRVCSVADQPLSCPTGTAVPHTRDRTPTVHQGALEVAANAAGDDILFRSFVSLSAVQFSTNDLFYESRDDPIVAVGVFGLAGVE